MGSDGLFKVERRVRFSHCDPGGIVYFPRYFDMMNALVEDWFYQRLSLDYAGRLMSDHQGLPTVHAECDFVRPSRMGEILSWSLAVDKIAAVRSRLPSPHPATEKSGSRPVWCWWRHRWTPTGRSPSPTICGMRSRPIRPHAADRMDEPKHCD